MSIMIADDNLVGAILLEVILQEQDYPTALVRTGSEALDCLATTPDITLVLANVTMPDMGRLELLSRIRAHLAWKCIPVIMLAARPDEETVKKAAVLDCQCFLIQPVDADVLVAKVHEVLHDQPSTNEETPAPIEGPSNGSVLGSFELNGIANQVFGAVKLLEQRIKEEAFNGLSSELGSLAESAETIGAERVVTILNRLNRGVWTDAPERLAYEYRLLLSELKTLYATLSYPKTAA